jgi:hypothetical protein
MLSKIPLENNVLDYIYEELKFGNTYAQAILDGNFRWTVSSYLPDKEMSKKVDFDESFEWTTGINIYGETREMVYQQISQFLHKSSSNVVLIETDYEQHHIDKIEPPIPTVFSYDSEMYFVLRPDDTREMISLSFAISRHYPFICGFIEMDEKVDTVASFAKTIANRDTWKMLANQTKTLIIGAYDNEGFLFCER